MLCKYYISALQRQCDKQADPSFPCCSVTHGMHFKRNLGWMRDYQAGRVKFGSFYLGMGMKNWTLSQAEYYAKLI